jgi:hypothetical protein
MNTQSPTSTDAAAVLVAARRALRADLAGLSREAVFLPAREWDIWCETVRLRLRALRQLLESHAAAHAGLLREHRSLLVRLDALAMEAALHVEPPLWTGALRELIADIAIHEERENELPLRELDRQPGAPD